MLIRRRHGFAAIYTLEKRQIARDRQVATDPESVVLGGASANVERPPASGGRSSPSP
jgi:hypothetical protein